VRCRGAADGTTGRERQEQVHAGGGRRAAPVFFIFFLQVILPTS
jgi:hypothetical protein